MLGMPFEATRIDPSGAAQAMREASVRPSTWNEEDRSVDLIWTTGAAVNRFDWYDGGYYSETLSTEADAIRTDRLNSIGPVLVDHIGRTPALAGSVVPGSVRIEKGQGIARIRLAGTSDMADTVAKVREGHLRTVSVGYAVHTYERTEGIDGERDTMHAVDWEPIEISLTPVPADAGAVIRNRSTTDMPEIIENEHNQRQAPAPRRGGRTVNADTIRDLCGRSDDIPRAFERALLEEHAEEPFSRRELEARIADQLVAARALPSIDTRSGGRGHTERHRQRDAFADILHARLSGSTVPDTAQEYAGASMIDMARGLLEANGERVRWARPAAVLDSLSRSNYETTSDFAYILNTAGRRYLIDAYGAVQSPLKLIARRRDFPDFRTRFGLQVEGPAALRIVRENAEFQRAAMYEAANGVQLGTYGEIFSISRQAIINDDLGVFSQIAAFWARAQAGTEASYLSALIAGRGIVLGEDAKTLYHADHGNLAPVAAAITPAALGAARQQMRTVKNRDGSTPANVVPKYLVVGPAKETEAEMALAQINAATFQTANPFSGKLELVVDALQTGNSWRLFGDPKINPVLEYGNLEGQGGLFTETRVGFDVDGVDFKARTDIGAGAIDYRGTLLNEGA